MIVEDPHRGADDRFLRLNAQEAHQRSAEEEQYYLEHEGESPRVRMASQAMFSQRTLDNALLRIFAQACLQVTHRIPFSDDS